MGCLPNLDTDVLYDLRVGHPKLSLSCFVSRSEDCSGDYTLHKAVFLNVKAVTARWAATALWKR